MCVCSCDEQEHRDYNPSRCHAFVCDICDERAQLPFPACSLDFIICIFVLSAIHPDKSVVHNLLTYLTVTQNCEFEKCS